MIRARRGAALLEVLVAAALAALVVASAVLLLQVQSGIAHRTTENSTRADAVRSALLTLSAEWRTLVPQRDIYALAGDSLTGRIFRGIAVVCARSANRTLVRYRGLRLPDPAKDSALQIGAEHSAAFTTAVADSGCAPAPREQVLSMDWTATPEIGSVWLLFESGGYHLGTYALRYRQRAESRQPITNEVFDHRNSGFQAVADSVTRSLDVRLGDRATGRTTRARIQLLNAR
jgi:hypothetical protein